MKLKSLILFILLSTSSVAFAESSLYESKLKSLKAIEGAIVSIQDGWTIIQINTTSLPVLWSFTPKDHPAHPAFAKRTISKRDGYWHVQSEIKCGAAKDECDKLVKEYNLLDEKMRNELAK